MQSKLAIAATRLFTRRSPTDKASSFKNQGLHSLNLAKPKPRKAEGKFNKAISNVEKALKTPSDENRNSLLQIKGEALLGLWKSRTPRAAESQYDADARMRPKLDEAISVFSDIGNMPMKAEALELRGGSEQGKRAMDDLYEACKCVPDDARSIKRMATAYLKECEIWDETPNLKRALEILSMLPPDDAWAAGKRKGLEGKMEGAPARKNMQAAEMSPDVANAILLQVSRMLEKGEIDLNDPRFAEEGVPVQVDGHAEPVFVRKEIPANFRNIYHSSLPDGWKDRAFMENLDMNRVLAARPAPIDRVYDSSGVGLPAESNLRLQAMMLDAQADELSKTDKGGALPIYLSALELYRKASEQKKDVMIGELMRRLEEKIEGCRGAV